MRKLDKAMYFLRKSFNNLKSYFSNPIQDTVVFGEHGIKFLCSYVLKYVPVKRAWLWGIFTMEDQKRRECRWVTSVNETSRKIYWLFQDSFYLNSKFNLVYPALNYAKRCEAHDIWEVFASTFDRVVKIRSKKDFKYSKVSFHTKQ